MNLPLYLALRNLLRHPGRNMLYVLGVSITAALLLDMILLSSGLKVSLEKVLNQMGWEIRLSPRGTLPFETDAQITGFRALRARIEQMGVTQSVDAMLGATLTVDFNGKQFTVFTAGVDLSRPVLYHLVEGSAPSANELLVNAALARAHHIRPGDTIRLWSAARAQTTGIPDATSARVSGIVTFELDAEGQYTLTCSVPLLQKIMGVEKHDPVSLVMIKLKNPREADPVAARLNKEFPQVSAYTIRTVVEAVDAQLSYFKQFAFILGGISLVVTFVLVFIITTISFHDRVGEIALLRAIGIGNKTLFTAVLFEGILTSLASAIFGFILGKIAAIYLDSVLMAAPGLPADFSFFVFEPSSVLRALLTLLVTGFFAGLYPAAAATRLPVADTLREEIL